MQYDTTHEYYIKDACIHYCSQHDALIIADHGVGNTDRLLINGIDEEVINRLRLELNKEALENVTDKDEVTC